MNDLHNKLVIQIDGRFCDVIDVTDTEFVDGPTQEVIFRSDKVKSAMKGIVPIRFVTVPRKLVNIVTEERSGGLGYRLFEIENPDGSITKTCEPA